MNFPLLPVDWYLLREVTGNRYLLRSSTENALFITSTGHVYVSRWLITLVTIPLLDFVMIHWIRWNPFWKNSIVFGPFQVRSRKTTRRIYRVDGLVQWWTAALTQYDMIWYDMKMLPAQADVLICWASLWTLLFWCRALCSSYSHLINLHFLPSSSTSVSYLLLLLPHLLLLLFHLLFQFLVPLPLINSSVPSYYFFIFFIHPLLFSLSSFNSSWFSSFFSLFLTLLFLFLCFFFLRGF